MEKEREIALYEGNYYLIVGYQAKVYWGKRLKKDMQTLDTRSKHLVNLPKNDCEIIKQKGDN